MPRCTIVFCKNVNLKVGRSSGSLCVESLQFSAPGWGVVGRSLCDEPLKHLVPCWDLEQGSGECS